jgi:hypothetical protein
VALYARDIQIRGDLRESFDIRHAVYSTVIA